MKKQDLKEYHSPEADVLETGLSESILQASNWNDGSLGDGFNELYDL